MKTISVMAIMVIIYSGVFAQNDSPISGISQHLTGYFSTYPKDKVFIVTDKQSYKPGETIWFNIIRATEQSPTKVNQDLIIELFNNKGEKIAGDKYQVMSGFTPGDLQLPLQLPAGQYFLIAYPSTLIDAEDISYILLNIDPEYSNQWLASITAKDSISVAGLKNELFIQLRNLAGEIQKNTPLRYQIANGSEIISNGKLKTNAKGSAVLSFTLPAKSNGEPFICKITDNKEEWGKMVFLPSNLDPIVIKFYPEGGTIVAGVPTKIGFTACDKWGNPVNIKGTIVDQDGKQIVLAKTFTKGLGLFAAEYHDNQKLKMVISGTNSQTQNFDIPVSNPTGLAFSVVKNDPSFISVNLIFADKLKHKITLAATCGGKLNWASDLEINGMGRIKIPTENLPQGINLLSVFSNEQNVLASRIVFVDKKQQLNVEVMPEKSKLKQGESMKIKIRMTDENNQPVSGFANVSISDSFRKNDSSPRLSYFPLDGASLENPFNLISEAFNGSVTNAALMDIFLITNRIKNFSVKATDQEGKHVLNIDFSKNLDDRIADYITEISKKSIFINKGLIPESNYFNNNPELFSRAPKSSKPNTSALDNQRRMLSTSSSLLDVIKTIKPYNIMNNMIVFVGSENSLFNQGGALIVWDGHQMGTDISAIQNIPSAEVDHISVSTNPIDIQRYTGLNSVGIIEIFSKKAELLPTPEKAEVVNKYNGEYRIPNMFPVEFPNLKKDFRTTLLWILELKINETGMAEISVTASRVLSDFIIEVQGINGNGRLGSGSATISVAK